MKVVNQQL